MKIKIIVLVGPTAVGKTSVGVELAGRLKTEIISADSMQIYKLLDIGTAKPSMEERKKVKHHLIDILEPSERFSAGKYARAAEKIIYGLDAQKKIPLIVGGSGLYVRSLVDGLFESPVVDENIRLKLQDEADKKGILFLYKRLQNIDKDASEKINPNDLKRIIRALEIFEQTGETITSLKKSQESKHKQVFSPVFIGLTMDRKDLHLRIEDRVDSMIKRGLVEETKNILKKGYSASDPGLIGLGYRQIVKYLEGEYPLDEAVQLIKKETKLYAKRQFTWFNRDKRIRWIMLTSKVSLEFTVDNVLKLIKDFKVQDYPA